MADLKISQLTGATTPLAGTEVVPLVQSSATRKVAVNDLTVKNIRSNATTGILQVVGPAAAATRVMTTPDANFTAARTDAAQSFTGDQTLSTGNLVVSSGKGIDFSATAGTGTSELLNDYEEGAWTPEIKFGGASTGITYSRQSGTYTKVGNVVTVVFDMRLTSKGTATGGLTIEGLPFASAGGVSAGFAIAQLYLYSGFVGLTKMGTAYTNGSTVLNEPIDSLSVAITNTNFTNSVILFASFTYRAA